MEVSKIFHSSDDSHLSAYGARGYYGSIMQAEYYLTVRCPDRPRLVSSITNFIAQSGGNILDLRQHTAEDFGMFFLKVRFSIQVLDENEKYFEKTFTEEFLPLAKGFSMDWQLIAKELKKRVAILVSKTDHCLYELLLKHRDGELDCVFPVIISNHPDLSPVAEQFGLPYHTIDTSAGREEAEAQIQVLLNEYKIDLVVMARYMQILTAAFTAAWEGRIINIHHGFLPAFKGAKPYHQAWFKGVKLIGATAHFATEDLDQGPIIAQDALRVSDTASIAEFVRLGKNIERKVLVDGLSLFLSHSVFVHEGRTFVLR